MKIEYNDIVIAQDGSAETDIIALSPLKRTSSEESVKLIGSRSPFFRSKRNAEYSLKATIPFFFEDYLQAYSKLYELADFFDYLPDSGTLRITDGGSYWQLSNAVVSAEFPEEITGCFFEMKLTAKGGAPRGFFGGIVPDAQTNAFKLKVPNSDTAAYLVVTRDEHANASTSLLSPDEFDGSSFIDAAEGLRLKIAGTSRHAVVALQEDEAGNVWPAIYPSGEFSGKTSARVFAAVKMKAFNSTSGYATLYLDSDETLSFL